MNKITLTASTAALALLGLTTHAKAGLLGSAESFAALAGAAVTSTGLTVLSGDLGVGPGGAITGFGPGVVINGSTYTGDATTVQALLDTKTAYDLLAGEAFDQNLTGQDLGGMTLFPGVYHFATSAFLTGTLTLDAQGDPNARFDFQTGSTLIAAPNAAVHVVGGGNGGNVFWQVGSSATLDTGVAFTGHILAMASITLNTGASIVDGSALARNGAVTLDTNAVSTPAPLPVPEPASLLALGGAGLATLARRRRK